jgi:hypothetical protein
MPLLSGRLKQAVKRQEIVRLEQRVRKLEQKLAVILKEQSSVQNEYALTDAQMKKVAQNLHARAKKKIAAGAGKEFKGDIEAIL